MSPFNRDDSRLLLVHQSYFALYDGEGRYQQDLPMEISAASEPRWSRTDPNVLYYVYGNSLKSYDASRGVRAAVHTFAEYSKISGRGEIPSPRWRTSPLTPMTVKVKLVLFGPSSSICFPTGLSPGQNRREAASLITITRGAFAESCSVNSLPPRSGIPIVLK